MNSDEIRERFLSFFTTNNHKQVNSSGLIPNEDPTLLFTNAGMVQFKDTFLGNDNRDYTKACSCQKSLRAGGKHNDLENVGRTRRHHTFFEMLGNFSFGDYFKEDAIKYAWIFLTEELKISSEKLYVTVFENDDEAEEIWSKYIDKKRIFRLGEKDNFWSMGETGPCGPCSEIIYDMGNLLQDPDEIDICDGERYLEIWNLVFMQFDRDTEGNLKKLPRPSIDTGMGLERLASILQNVDSNYDTDLFKDLINFSSLAKGVEYGKNNEFDVSYRVLADHARAATFLISDGVIPSSEGRGYVLRRILRRAIRHYKKLNINEPYLFKLSELVINKMKPFYIELEKNKENILSMIKIEEQKFLATIDKGLDLLNDYLELAKDTKILSGKNIFKLYDTFGFPVDLIEDILKSSDIKMDIEGYEEEMLIQRKSSKVSSKFKSTISENLNLSQISSKVTDGFVGYDSFESESKIIGIIKDNEIVENSMQNEKVLIIFDKTPFYGESGGQIGDKGNATSNKVEIEIFDTQKTKDGLILHNSIIKKGNISNGDTLTLNINSRLRKSISQHHSATHILHYALRKILGSHVRQAGSLVESNRLRFDFSHFNNIDNEQLLQIEKECNLKILENSVIKIDENVPYKKAIKNGANAFFEEKYGEFVRVVNIGDYSMELCGGTHVDRSGDLGFISIYSEGSISSGIRRIEAYTSTTALNFYLSMKDNINNSAKLLSSSSENINNEIRRIMKENVELKNKINVFEKNKTQNLATDLKLNPILYNGIKIISFLTSDTSPNDLKSIWDNIKKAENNIIGIFASNNENKTVLICAAKLDQKDFKCNQAINIISEKFNGKGGGKKDLAQAGCDKIDSLDNAIDIVKNLL